MRRRWPIGVAAIAVLAAAIVASILRHGISAADEPTLVETWIARSMRHFAVPLKLRDAKNPLALTPQVRADGREHFADHCASCHGNDGKGAGIGARMYPKAPDMTLAQTQSLSDGELFAIIENGVRLTGMPAFGDGSDGKSTWALVHFIRHLPRITPAELAAMEKLNPKSPAEFEAAREEEEFLRGADGSKESDETHRP